MAIGQVKAKSYDYGSYARPQQVRLGDTTGLGRGIVSAVGSIAEGAEKAIAEKKAKAEADKIKAQQEGQVEALRKKSLENVATSAETLKFISEAQTNLENMYESGELSDKEYGRLKAIEQENYKDTLALGTALDSIEKIEFDPSQIKEGDLEKMLLRNAIADGQYNISDYTLEDGARINIDYIDANGELVVRTFTAAQALDYLGDAKKSQPQFKFNYAEDGADLLKMAGEIYNSTGMVDEDIKVDGKGYRTLDREKAAMRIASDPELRDFVRRNGARIWEDVIPGEDKGPWEATEEQIEAVAMNIGENAAASRHIKQGYGKVEPPKPGKPLTKDQRQLVAQQQLIDFAINKGLLGDMAGKIFGAGNVREENGQFIITTTDDNNKPIEVPYSPELLVQDILKQVDPYTFVQSYVSQGVKSQQEAEEGPKQPAVDYSQFKRN